jgi:hypothetical protein
MSDWQSIETAPKDGTMVLLAWGTCSVASGFWWTPDRFSPVGHWHIGDTEDRLPTHWMPLPDPPAVTPQAETRGQ